MRNLAIVNVKALGKKITVCWALFRDYTPPPFCTIYSFYHSDSIFIWFHDACVNALGINLLWKSVSVLLIFNFSITDFILYNFRMDV